MYATAGALPCALIGFVAGWKQFRARTAKKVAAARAGLGSGSR
jgi:hypothetical protein